MANSAGSTIVLEGFADGVVREAARATLAKVGGQVTVGFAFFSPDYRDNLEDFLEIVQLHGHVPLLVGCSGIGLIGAAVEAEQLSGFSLLFLNLPATRVTPVVIGADEAAEPDAAGRWRQAAGVADSAGQAPGAWVAMIDPRACDVERWVAGWNRAFPGVPVVGGLLSGNRGGEDLVVFQGRRPVEGAGVAVGFAGGVRLVPLVSQSCRPIGEPITITGAERNVIFRLGAHTAYEALNLSFAELGDAEKAQARGNLFAGLASSEYVEDFRRGDFLIRNIIGADPDSGAVAIAGRPRVGQTMQFQFRDGASAIEDFRGRAGELRDRLVKPFASLLFSCTGRGRALFGTPDADACGLVEVFGPHPGAGVFCDGEIGPIGEANYIHGYTASAALFVSPPVA